MGNPKSGKSTVAEMLVDEFDGWIQDDGLILRQAVPILLGIDPTDTFTQEGKAKTVRIGDRDEIVRQALGELGNWMEARYGEDILPLRAIQIALDKEPNAPFYIYPSCRKTQGRVYKRYGGVVIQIDNPNVAPSGNAFDVWDRACVDIRLDNSGSLGDLRELVKSLPELIAAL